VIGAPGTLVPPGRVFGPLLLASGFEAVGFLLLGGVDPGLSHWYGQPLLLAAVHAWTVGVLALAVVGVAWQLLPVVTTLPPGRWTDWLAPWLSGGLAVGAMLLVHGMAVGGAGLWWGGLLAGACLFVRALLVLVALSGARARLVTRTWLAGAELCLLAGVTLGLMLALGRVGHPLLGDPLLSVGQHASLLLGGWIGGYVGAIGAMLLPMFAVSGEPDRRALGLVASIALAGALLGLPAAMLVAAVGWIGLVGAAVFRRARPKLGPGVVQALTGALVVAFGVSLLSAAPDPRTAAFGVGAALLGCLAVVRGVGNRIGPFLAWGHANLGGGGRRGPGAADLLPDRRAWAAFLLSVAGSVSLLVGFAAQQPAAWFLGTALGALGALSHLALLLVALSRALQGHRARRALPGMES
jgi:hypothetical protein